MNTDPINNLNFFDTYFTPELKSEEINSVCGNKSEKRDEEKEVQKYNEEGVKIYYTGNKNRQAKGINSERHDVVKKTLLRSIRRYLWDLFNEEDYETISLTRKTSETSNGSNNLKGKRSLIFKERVTLFYEKYFKSALKGNEAGQKEEAIFIEILAMFMTSNHSLPTYSSRIRNIKALTNIVMAKYKVKKYNKFFRMEEILSFLKIMKE